MQIKSTLGQDIRHLRVETQNKTDAKDKVSKESQISGVAQQKNTEKLKGSAASIAKKQMNAQILKAASEASISAGDKPLALVLKTALEGVNKALQATMGDNAIQKSYEAGVDVTPKATADRIVSLSTAFFGKYQEKHPDMSQQEALKSFTDIISGGIDTGFDDARKILKGLGVLKGDIAKNIDKTYSLVQEGLKSFVDNYGKSESNKVSSGAEASSVN